MCEQVAKYHFPPVLASILILSGKNCNVQFHPLYGENDSLRNLPISNNMLARDKNMVFNPFRPPFWSDGENMCTLRFSLHPLKMILI